LFAEPTDKHGDERTSVEGLPISNDQ
jgi:hypothetical protein